MGQTNKKKTRSQYSKLGGLIKQIKILKEKHTKQKKNGINQTGRYCFTALQTQTVYHRFRIKV